MASAHSGTHVGVAEIKHHGEIVMAHFADHIQDLARFVKHESGLKFPGHHHTVLASNFGIVAKCFHSPGPRVRIAYASR